MSHRTPPSPLHAIDVVSFGLCGRDVVLDNEGSDPSVLEAQLGGLEEQIHALGKFQL